MDAVKPHDTVTVLFEGRTADGEIFDQADADHPLVFTLGDERIMPAFAAAIIGMRPGETKTFTVEADRAFGPHLPELVQTVPRSRFNGEITVGAVVSMRMEREGEVHNLPAQVVEVTEETVTVDFNHPLAGQTVTYTVTLQNIVHSGTG